jgi:Tol biopolymer transport system component
VRARFEREARAVSSLSHPHICTLHDIGHHEGCDYLVMEYLEGETLAARLERGPLPAEELLRYATQIADALDKAHRQGLVHRDLKPGNVMLTKSGAKLLDFGLAKAIGLAPGISDLTSSPTVSRPLTAQGTIVGTFQYMSPEVLEGKEADARSDIFSFGAVLYEMATGKRAFEGKSQASVIAAILKTDPPPISSLQPMAPPALERVVRSCLAKDPDDRWQTAHDLSLQLKWILEGGSQAGVAAPIATRRKTQQWAAWGIAAVLLVTTAVLAILYFRPVPAAGSLRFNIPAPEKVSYGVSFALSPDGKMLAFVSRDAAGKEQLWLRPLDSLEARALSGADEASFPFWSPDGRQIAFFAKGKLKKIDAAGGPVQTLADAPDGRGGTWNRDGLILFGPAPYVVLHSVPAAGGVTTPVTVLDKSRQESGHRWPHFLPDGRHFLFAARSSVPENEAIFVGSLDGKESRLLLPVLSSSQFVPPSTLLYVRENTLIAQPFDPGKLRVTGDPIPIAEMVEILGADAPTGYAAFSAAGNAVLTYRTSQTGRNAELVWFDRKGKRLGAVGQKGEYDEPALSPDGKHLVVDYREPGSRNEDLWILDLVRGTFSRFVNRPGLDITPLWAPDGNGVYYATQKNKFELYYRALTSDAKDELRLSAPTNKYVDDASRDGKFLLYEDEDPKTKYDLWVLPLSAGGKPQVFRKTDYNEAHARFSPEGKWVAYSSDESGKPEVWVQAFPGPGQRWQISTTGGDQPAWRGDGKELFYVGPDKKLMSVSIKAGPGIEAGVPQPLFDMHIRTEPITGSRNQYAMTPDGQRFLVVTLLEEAARPPITVVTNWTTALRK